MAHWLIIIILILFGRREKMPFFEVWVSFVLMQNPDIWNFHSSLTLNNGKLIWCFYSSWYAIVSNMTHFLILFGMREKMAFIELWISPVLRQDQDTWSFYSSLTLNNGKLIWYVKNPYCAIVSNMTYFFILFGMGRKMAYIELWISPVLRQDQDTWNFYGSLTLNNGKLIWYVRNPYYAIVSNMTHFLILFGMRQKMCPCLKYRFHLYWHKF